MGSHSAVNLGRTSLEMTDSIHTLFILLFRHREDIMMKLEELKREKVANEDMEVFPDGRRTRENKHQRPLLSKSLVRFGTVFVFNQEDFERNLNLHGCAIW